METDETRIEFASALCRFMDFSGIQYGVIHGAENYPQKIGRDLDIMLSKDDIPRTVAAVRKVALTLGWKSVIAPLPWAGAPVLFWRTEHRRVASFELHFIDKIIWGGVTLASADPSDISKSPVHDLPLAVRAGFAKRVLTQILAGCWGRMAERGEEITIFLHEQEQAGSLMEELFGKKHATILHSALASGKLDKLRNLSRRLRIAAVLRALNPAFGPKFTTRWFGEKLQRWLGLAEWYLPNLILLAPTREAALEYLNTTLPILSFSKAMLLKPIESCQRRPPFSAFHIRQHRGLFRYLVVAESYNRRTEAEFLIPEPRANSGNLIVTIQENGKERTVRTEFQLGKEIRQIFMTLPPEEIAANIAVQFFLATDATANGIDRFHSY